MTASGPERSGARVTGLDLALSIVVLFNLAIARPVLDLLGRNPEFFIAHDWSGRDAVLLAVLLTIVVPAIVGGLLWIAARSWSGGQWLHHFVFGALCAVLVVQILKSVDPIAGAPGALLVATAIVIGASIALLYSRSGGFRSFLRMGAFVPLLVLGVFVFGSRAGDLISPTTTDTADRSPASDPAPIVLIVMDELPVASLMDRGGHIDRRLFPNFARAMDDFTWFRDATTVHNLTTHAIPSLLDGTYPKKGSLPTVDDHPSNLFTLLSPQYELKVVEQVTDLCPATLCRDIGQRFSFGTKWSGALSDLRVVLGHILLPADLAASLPPVDENWSGFGERKTIAESMTDPLGDLEAFELALEVDDQPQLLFLHLMLPHTPWRFLPSGSNYPETAPPLAGFSVRDNGSKKWGDEAWPVMQAYQRHLLQVGFVDRLVGGVIDQLRAEELYDDAMIVLTSDHGAVFRTGTGKRAVAPDTVGDVAAVPLFIKEPGQKEGSIKDDPAQTIDILPTIVDAIGATPPDDLDGRSLFTDPPDGGVTRTMFAGDRSLDIGDAFDRTMAAAHVKYGLFPLGGGVSGLFGLAPGDTENLLGTRTSRLTLGPRFSGAARINSPSLYDDVDRESDLLPAMVAGTLTASNDEAEWPARVVVSVNGRVGAVTQTFDRTGDTADFYAVLPPRAFVDGSNTIELFVLGGDDSSPLLAPVTIEGG